MANKFGRAIGGNWSTDATWSTTSGGAADTTKPTAADDVFLNASSGNITIDTNTTVAKTLTCTGYTGTLTWAGFTFTVSGSVLFVAGMTISGNGVSTSLVFNASATLTTGGKAMPTLISMTGGTLTLGDNFAGSANALGTLTLGVAGILDVNSKTMSGNSAVNRWLITSSVMGSGRSVLNATNTTFANCDFRDLTFTSALDLDLSAITGFSGDSGGNTITGGGTTLTFTPQANQTVTMATNKNWSDATIYTSRVPLPQDNVSMSGVTGGTLTVNSISRIGANIDWTGATGSPTWTNATGAVTLTGSLTLINTMTLTTTQTFIFSGRTSGLTITSAGKSFATATINAPGGTYTMQDAFSLSGRLTGTNGTLKTNGFNVTYTVSGSAGLSTAAGFTYDWGDTTTHTFSGTTAANMISLAANTIINAANSTILISTASTGLRSITCAGNSFGTLTYTVAGSTGTLQLSNASSWGAINFSDITNARTLILPIQTTTIRSASGFNVNGTAGKLMSITSPTGGTPAPLSIASGIVSCDYLSIQDSTATGGATFYAGDNSVSVSGNTGWLFKSRPTATLTESSTLTDAMLKLQGRNLSESATFTDSFFRTFGRVFSDEIDLSENLITTLAGAWYRKISRSWYAKVVSQLWYDKNV